MHKRTCLAPIDRNVQGIFFEAGHDAPSVINVPLKTDIVRDIFDIGAQEVKMPIFLPLLGDGHRGHLRITTDGMNGKQLEQQYILFFRDDFLNDGSPPNNIPKILTNGRAPHPWAGNLLALKETYFDSGMWADCTIEEDLPTLVRYFEWYPSLDPGYRPQVSNRYPLNSNSQNLVHHRSVHSYFKEGRIMWGCREYLSIRYVCGNEKVSRIFKGVYFSSAKQMHSSLLYCIQMGLRLYYACVTFS